MYEGLAGCQRTARHGGCFFSSCSCTALSLAGSSIATSTLQTLVVSRHVGRDRSLWHPWLRINRLLRAMLHERWSAEAWPQVKAEFKKALALKSQIRRAGWFN